MALLDKEEVRKLARLSALQFEEQELGILSTHVSAILEYVQLLQKAPVSGALEPRLVTNVLRQDVAQRFDAPAILAQGPDVRDGFFVVPKILDEK